jgi:hypothetical protein
VTVRTIGCRILCALFGSQSNELPLDKKKELDDCKTTRSGSSDMK